MPDLRVYARHEIPPLLACQIRSYVRVQWPSLDLRPAVWNHTPDGDPADAATHFLLTEGEMLVSHASVRTRTVRHAGTPYRVAGLSTVFTYPDFRGRGLGEQVVRAATDHIRRSGDDLAMLFCGDRVQPLYLRCGWEPVPSARIYYGDEREPNLKDDNLVLMLFLSEIGRAAREMFERDPVYVGPSTW